MSSLEQIILIVHVLVAIVILALIMLQQGKGADAGASFGGGASQTVLGVAGSGNLLTHWTSILAAVFFATSLSLAYFAKQQSEIVEGLIDVPAIESVTDKSANEEVPVVENDVKSEIGSDVPAGDVSAVDSSSEDIPE